MNIKYYQYYHFGNLLQRVGSWLMLLSLVVFTVAAIPQQPDALICMLPMILFVLPICLFNAYMYPRVGVCDAGVSITFLLREILIPWEDIVDVRKTWFLPRAIIVRARRITPFHIVYGMVYSSSLFPSFLISSSIDNYRELAAEIQKRIQSWDA
ncbi:MAG: PH domain-containing protein [Chloroflexi bacterium]|nr:PH domain-containing protein [Chloroflexota bacterium]MBU1749298.1 PH domain-containing protein [Chloroflexota bacterium]